MKKTKKTIKVSDLVAKANFDILVGTYVYGYKTISRAKFDCISNTLSNFDAYNGFNMLFCAEDVKSVIRNYPNHLYSEEEIQMVLDAHKACETRIADMWYNETGNTLSEVFNETHENGWIKNHDLFTEWLQYSALHFEKENWVFLY